MDCANAALIHMCYALLHDTITQSFFIIAIGYFCSVHEGNQSFICWQVTIVILPNDNNHPSFDSNLYSANVLAPKLAGDVVINLENNATDPDYPATGVGQIVFIELTERKNTGEGMYI